MRKTIVKRSPLHGRGLFAFRDLSRGESLGTFRGRRTQRNSPYVLWVTGRDGKPYGILGNTKLRFVNHSEHPNAEFQGTKLIARRRIRRDQEVTINYHN